MYKPSCRSVAHWFKKKNGLDNRRATVPPIEKSVYLLHTKKFFVCNFYMQFDVKVVKNMLGTHS